MACFMGLLGLFIGLIVGIIAFIASMFGGGDVMTSFLSISGGILYLLIVPLVYGVLSFLSGFISTPLMNLTLKITKGIDLDIEMQEETPAVAESQRPNLEALQSS